jgi:hypothetical protein
MNTKYTVWTASELKTGEIALSGSVNGPFLSIGQEGETVTPQGLVKVVVIGTGVVDPNLVPADRQGLLVKVLEGSATSLQQGLILDFCGK